MRRRARSTTHSPGLSSSDSAFITWNCAPSRRPKPIGSESTVTDPPSLCTLRTRTHASAHSKRQSPYAHSSGSFAHLARRSLGNSNSPEHVRPGAGSPIGRPALAKPSFGQRAGTSRSPAWKSAIGCSCR